MVRADLFRDLGGVNEHVVTRAQVDAAVLQAAARLQGHDVVAVVRGDASANGADVDNEVGACQGHDGGVIFDVTVLRLTDGFDDPLVENCDGNVSVGTDPELASADESTVPDGRSGRFRVVARVIAAAVAVPGVLVRSRGQDAAGGLSFGFDDALVCQRPGNGRADGVVTLCGDNTAGSVYDDRLGMIGPNPGPVLGFDEDGSFVFKDASVGTEQDTAVLPSGGMNQPRAAVVNESPVACRVYADRPGSIAADSDRAVVQHHVAGALGVYTDAFFAVDELDGGGLPVFDDVAAAFNPYGPAGAGGIRSDETVVAHGVGRAADLHGHLAALRFIVEPLGLDDTASRVFHHVAGARYLDADGGPPAPSISPSL